MRVRPLLRIKVTDVKNNNGFHRRVSTPYKKQHRINRIAFAAYGALRRVASGRFARWRIVGSNKEQKTRVNNIT